MRVLRSNPLIKNGPAVLFVLFLLSLNGVVLADPPDPELRELLPDLEEWTLKDSPLTFQPQNLYEHIDGAAEIYLSYDFKELVAAEYTPKKGNASVSVEIYNMGSQKNSFGIYSAETYPESEFIPVGIEGYIEKGSLNFLVGEYYVKLLCFECGEQGDDYLKLFAEDIVQKVPHKGQFPPDLNHFPKEGLVAHTQKFVLENFMGYQFFHNGYTAHYKKEELEFDCFLIHAEDKKEAQSMLEQYLDKKSEAGPQKISSGYHIKDPYYQHVYIARVKEYLCGVMKIQDGREETGIRYLNLLIQNLKNR